MPKRTETTQRDPATTERALPPGRSRTPSSRTPSRSGASGNGRPNEPAELRREIERTRARMSSTLDAVEARIVYERESLERKKDELVDRATLRGVREKLGRDPWRSMAIAFVAGYVIAAIRD